MKNETINKLLLDEQKNTEKPHKILKDAIDAEELIIRNLANPEIENLDFRQRVSDHMALFGCS